MRRTSMWQIRAALPPWWTSGLAVAGLLVPLLLWWLFCAMQWVEPVFMPSPPVVLQRIVSWWHDGDLLGDTLVSCGRVLGGFMLSAILAVPLGLMIGTFRPVAGVLEPLIDFIRYMPAAAFIPLVMLWLGIDEGAKIAIIFIGTFFQMVLMVAEDIRRVPQAQVEAAQTMGSNREEIIRLVIFPSAKPAIFDTMRVTLGWAWTYLVVAELVAANSGLGYAILKAQRFLQTDKIFAGILLIGAIGLISDQSLRALHRKLFPYLVKH